MKKLLAILTAAVFSVTAILPAFAAEPGDMTAEPAAKSAKGGHKVKKAKKIKKAKKPAKHKVKHARKHRR